MAINKVNTTAEEKSFKFLKNQSTILRTAETNNITINGVNVIVEKPKVGDVMCVTKYKDSSNTLLGADKQKVIWIDGLSINPDKLSEEYEPVGICMVVNGNKALVKYRGTENHEFSNKYILELPYSSYMNDNTEHNFLFYDDTGASIGTYVFTASDTSSRHRFVQRLNDFFTAYYSLNYYAELVELDSEIPVSAYIDADKMQNGSYTNRVIIISNNSTSYFTIKDSATNEDISKAKHVAIKGAKSNSYIYRKNGFLNDNREIGCCRAAYYDYCAYNGDNPGRPLTTINTNAPVSYDYFVASSLKNYSTYYSPILHNTFDNYEDYIDSFMIKYPCGAGGIVADDPSGKESTYKLGNSIYHDKVNNNAYALYPAAYYATNISVNAPNLGKGNWWIPSISEMAQMMRDRDITGRSSYLLTKPDIVNTVLKKLNWDLLRENVSMCTCSLCDNDPGHSYMYFFNGENSSSYKGCIENTPLNNMYKVTPITIYEF